MSARVTFRADGRDLDAPAGQTLTAALVQHGIRELRRNPATAEARGAFCGMGACFECEVEVDGRLARACLTEVRAGMDVHTLATR